MRLRRCLGLVLVIVPAFARLHALDATGTIKGRVLNATEGIAMNIFTPSDFFYPNGLNAKGLVRISPDLSCAGPKPAYFAVQNVFAIFDRTVVLAPEITMKPADSAAALACEAYRFESSKRPLVTLWFKGEPPKTEDRDRNIDVTVAGGLFTYPVLVDLRTGILYEIPANRSFRRPG